MTTAGWIFMFCSIGFVVCLNIFCFSRVLFGRGATEETRDDEQPVGRP